jgi:twitching motility protein PilU
MIGFRNQHGDGHILTVEDPVEFVHQHDRCLVTQREVGIDTASFDVALKNSLRQAPDVILIGEIRSQETMEFAIQFAETGHLCLATLHANNANQALDRILHLVPQEKHRQFLFDLSFNLPPSSPSSCSLRSQAAGFSSDPAQHPLVTDIIRKGEMHRLKEVMTKSGELGMQTFDQALFTLFCAGQIGYSEALAHADSANDLRLLIKLSGREQLGAGTLDNVTLDE